MSIYNTAVNKPISTLMVYIAIMMFKIMYLQMQIQTGTMQQMRQIAVC